MSTDKLPTYHFERMNDGGMRLSPAAWEILCQLMIDTEYETRGPFKIEPAKEDEGVLKLRQMFVDDGLYELPELT